MGGNSGTKKNWNWGNKYVTISKGTGNPLAPGLFPESMLGKRHRILKFKDVNKAFVTCSTSFRT